MAGAGPGGAVLPELPPLPILLDLSDSGSESYCGQEVGHVALTLTNFPERQTKQNKMKPTLSEERKSLQKYMHSLGVSYNLHASSKNIPKL